ncbi:MAG: hypothetical protein HQK91_04200 [Nitrospirae bacterium]|nr:hypothetical protein [Nitrospirota bacterium]MBF0540637.1 hypothetical protein [Nitrospirota bacterium]
MEIFILTMVIEMIAAFILTSITFIKLIVKTVNNTKNEIELARAVQLEMRFK